VSQHLSTEQASLFDALGRAERSGATPWRVETPRGWAGIFYWLPVFVPMALFAQFALLGLRPALSESARLGAAEARLIENYESELARAERIDTVLHAQRDPIYLERERRMILSADSDLLGR
jgi:hypothetical protein